MSSVYDYVNEKIIAELEKGNIPWQKNWQGQKAINYITRKEYKGINTLLLPFHGEYLTFKQIQELKGSVKKGEKASMIVFYNWVEKTNEKGEQETFPILKYYNVFHISQCEGIETKLPPFTAQAEVNVITEAEKVITEYVKRERINFNVILGSDRAYYSENNDTVVMPDISQFDFSENYYSTAFHELTHSTGHKNRLDRFSKQKTHNFGSKDYSKEELVAEIGACYLNNTIGIDNTKVFTNNVAYIQSWLKALKNDVKLITIASGQAQKAVNRILNIKDSERVEA